MMRQGFFSEAVKEKAYETAEIKEGQLDADVGAGIAVLLQAAGATMQVSVFLLFAVKVSNVQRLSVIANDMPIMCLKQKRSIENQMERFWTIFLLLKSYLLPIHNMKHRNSLHYIQPYLISIPCQLT